MMSIQASPVNVSAGAFEVDCFAAICIAFLLVAAASVA
jgi:hypothetical protein